MTSIPISVPKCVLLCVLSLSKRFERAAGSQRAGCVEKTPERLVMWRLLTHLKSEANIRVTPHGGSVRTNWHEAGRASA